MRRSNSSKKESRVKSKEEVPSDYDSEPVGGSGNEARREEKKAPKPKSSMIASIFASKQKQKKPREFMSDSGSEERDEGNKKQKKKKRDKEDRKSRKNKKSKKKRRHSESESSDESPYRSKASPGSQSSQSPESKRPMTERKMSERHPSDRKVSPAPHYPEAPGPGKAVPGMPSVLSPMASDPEEPAAGTDIVPKEEPVKMEVEEEEAEPYCQAHHRPHPGLEELQDHKYIAKLEAISSAIADPHTGQEQLNSIVDIIMETGNFSTSSESFDFDICNLERSVVQQIESVLGLA